MVMRDYLSDTRQMTDSYLSPLVLLPYVGFQTLRPLCPGGLSELDQEPSRPRHQPSRILVRLGHQSQRSIFESRVG